MAVLRGLFASDYGVYRGHVDLRRQPRLDARVDLLANRKDVAVKQSGRSQGDGADR